MTEKIEREKQIIDFSGLRFGDITPTDYDGFLDFENKVFIWFKLKLENAPEIPARQKLALQRLCDAAQKTDISSWVLLCSHSVQDPLQDIDASTSMVFQVYRKGKWESRPTGITLKTAIDKIMGIDAKPEPCTICQNPVIFKDGLCENCYLANQGWETK